MASCAMDDRYFHSAFMYVSLNMPFFVVLCLCRFLFKISLILTKDFHCLNSVNLRKRNLSNGRFSVTGYGNNQFTYVKKPSLLHVSILCHFEIVQIISPNTREIIWSASSAQTTDNFQALLRASFLGSVFYFFLANIGPRSGPCITPFPSFHIFLWQPYTFKEHSMNHNCLFSTFCWQT